MTEKITPEEDVLPYDWLKETSHLTYQHPSHFSDLSKDHFLDDLIKQPQPAQAADQRTRSKANNSKHYRERKKGQLEQMRRQVDSLNQENQLLRAQKYCRWCQRSFDHSVLVKEQTITHQKP